MKIAYLMFVLVLMLFIVSSVLAEWSADPTVNFLLADRNGEQNQPKIHAVGDGGAYISWFDNANGGYDVYLQRIGPDGSEQWSHNGVLVADRSFTSTQDYDLDVDLAGNALLIFRDDRSGSTQITVNKVALDGALLWGSSGKQLTSGNAFFAAPQIAVTSDGFAVAGWTADSTIQFQRLDGNGNGMWFDDLTLADPDGGTFALADLNTSDNGAVIASWVKSGSFFDPRHIWTQKISAGGSQMWNANHVRVLDSGSLQFGNFPAFLPDGAGGAVFAWYTTSPLQSYVQRVDSLGNEVFAHNGVEVATMPGRARVNPAVSFNAATQETFVFWVEQSSNQSQEGVFGQKISSSGIRQWSDNGLEIIPLGSNDLTQVRNQQMGDGAVVYYVDSPSFGDDTIRAAGLDNDGNYVWSGNVVGVSTIASNKSRLTLDTAVSGDAMLVWADARNDANDLFIQNLSSDGELGGCTGVAADFDCNGNVDLLDFDDFESCMTGPNTALDPGCDAMDLDSDVDVDMGDFELFQAAFTG